jgi:hypothetical protein
MKLEGANVSPFITIQGPDERTVTGVNQNPLAKPTSDVERIADARSRGIALSKSYNKFGNYGPLHDEKYWTDFAGECTSHHDADTLICLLGFLNVDGFENAVPLAQAGNLLAYNSYQRREGVWRRGSESIAIQAVREIVDARIRELGLSKAAIFEYMAEPHDSSLDALSFDERMTKFRE